MTGLVEQNVSALTCESHDLTLIDGAAQLLAQAHPPMPCRRRVRAAETFDVLWRGDDSVVECLACLGRQGHRDVPCHKQSVGLIARVDGIRHSPVEVDELIDGARAQPTDVEPGVAAHQRIEGPCHDLDPMRCGPLPLVQLQGPADV